MPFASDFAGCLSPLPVPADAANDIADVIDFLDSLREAWELSGGSEELQLAMLIASGAGAGLADEVSEAAAVAAGITVAAYITACAGCAVSAGGPAIWRYITASKNSYVKDTLTVAANDAGVAPPEAVA